ncbi:MAG: methionine--tRNA ligase subunit beta [Candidatus Micrarchaeia archaeon]
MISYNEFSKIELAVAKIIDVTEIENSNKLYKLIVDVGEAQTRTIIAGIKHYYKKEELIGKNIVIIINLEPRSLAGIQSQGMLLAAEDDLGNVVLLTPDKEIKPGSRIR